MGRRNWWGSGPEPSKRWPGVFPKLTAGRSFVFDHAAADTAERFFPTCLEHHIGAWNGKPFVLMDYQRVLVRALFGWKRKTTGLRRFSKVFLAVPKGNGKSPFAAGLGLLGAFFDDESGSEAYAVAADRKQANIVFDGAKVMVERNQEWSGLFSIYRDSIKLGTSSFQVLSSDASTKHGFRPHVIVFDEFHAQPNRELYDTLARGMGKRRQPILVMITTAGDDDESICYEEWDYSRRVISGTIQDESWLPMVFEGRPDEDWTSEATWKRLNPGYGVTMRADYFRTECQAAQAEPRKRNSFLQLHCNRWVNQATAWIPVEWWDQCHTPACQSTPGLATTAGLDLSRKYDLTAFVVVQRRMLDDSQTVETVAVDDDTGEASAVQHDLNYELLVHPFFWLPEKTLAEYSATDRVPYAQWAEQGLLTVTEGATIDYTRVLRDIIHTIVPRFPGLRDGGTIGYDDNFAGDIVDRLKDEGRLECHEVRQSYTDMSEPAQILEALLRARRIRHDGHRVLRNHIENVEIKTDDAGRIKPVKPKRAKHVDGVVALIMGISELLAIPPYDNAVEVWVA